MAAAPPRFLQESMELGILLESGQGKQVTFLRFCWWRQVGPGRQQSSTSSARQRGPGLWGDQLPAEAGGERDKVEEASPFSLSSTKTLFL